MAKRERKGAGQKPSARELPPVGTELMGRYRGQELSARIVADEERGGAPAVECRGNRHRSLSAAARAIDTGFKLEALSLGEATQRIAIEEDDDRLRRLSDEDLDLLIRQARAAQPGSSPGEGEAPSG
jgi:hypothetical protein